MQSPHVSPEIAESAKVAATGAAGMFGTITLGEIHALVGIGVGCVTICYIAAKTFYLIRSGGKSKGE
jgi:hypothetical protein